MIKVRTASNNRRINQNHVYKNQNTDPYSTIAARNSAVLIVISIKDRRCAQDRQ